jgi:tetratricopeptide repeat protein
VADKDEAESDEAAEADAPAIPEPPSTVNAIGKKRLIWIGVIAAAVWAFAIQTGSTVLMIIVGVLTVAVAVLLLWAFRVIKKQRRTVDILRGSVASPEARKDALAKLEAGKDADSPINLFARAQLMAADDPKAALALLAPVELKTFPPAMQDDVSLLKAQLYLGLGRTQDARKCADAINLDNPDRKEMRALGASIVAEAWARTGKWKDALPLLDSIEMPKKDAEQIAIQVRIAKVFARFASGNRTAARNELVALADQDVNLLGRFVMPQFRVHPELQKLARRVIEQHPAARKMAKSQVKTVRNR